MSKRITIACCCLLVLCVPLAASGQGMSGNWEAVVFGMKVADAQVHIQGQKVSGVAYVYGPFGKRITYHFYGGVQGNTVYARHNDGHVFQGTITGPGQVSGTLTTKKGRTVPVTANRR